MELILAIILENITWLLFLPKNMSKLEIHEGKSLKILNCMEALYNKHIVPYDSFALNLYYNKSTIIE